MGHLLLALLLTAIAAAQPQPPNDGQKLAGRTVVFSVDLPMDVPGAVLQPGTYVLRVSREPGRTGDFVQLQLWDAGETSVLAELSAVHSYDAGSPDNSIMTYYEGTARRRILKAWNLLPTHFTLRIVYPPAQAAELARITSETVLSMPLAGATAVTAPAAPSTPPSTRDASREDTTPATQPPPTAFPKTAGNLPLVLWLGFTALAAFIVFRMYRIDHAGAQNARNNAVARRAAAAAYRTYQTARAAAGKRA